MAQSEAAMKQAESASTAAKSLLAQRGEIAQNTSNEAHDKEVSSYNLCLHLIYLDISTEKSE